MRFWGVVIACVVVAYGVDAYFYKGLYFGALSQMGSRIVHHMR